MMTRTAPDLAALAAAVDRRARAVAGAVHRMDGLLPGGAAEPVSASRADRRILALRLLHVAGLPSTDLLLRAVLDEARSTGVLAELLGQDPVAFWETLSDLVQVGLVDHEPERGTVCVTAAGRAAVQLIDHCADREVTP